MRDVNVARPSTDAHRGGPLLRRAALVLPLALSAWVFFPILRNYFRGDDFLSFYMLRNLPLFDYLVEPRAGHLLFTSNLAFLAAATAFGTNPAPYFWTVLVLHLVNVLLLFGLLSMLTESRLTACFGATLWGVSPAHGETLGWFSVIGHVMVATALLCVLLGIARAGAQPAPAKRLGVRLAAWALLIVAASGCFGVGLGIAMAMPVIAFLLLPPGSGRRRTVASLVLAAAVVVVLYQALKLSPGRPQRSSAITSALQAATARARPLVTMTLRLAEHGTASLLVGFWLDPFRPSRTATATASLATLALVLLGSIGAAPTRRRILLAGLVIAAAAYAVVAAGRVDFFIRGNNALIRAGRYQYVAQIGTTISICVALGGLARLIPLPRRAAGGLFAASIALTLWGGAVRGAYIVDNASGRRETATALAEIGRSIEATPEGGEVYIPNRVLKSFGIIGRVEEVLPGWAAVFIIFYPENVVDGRRVHFVTTHPGALRAAQRGRRSATLLVPPADNDRPPWPRLVARRKGDTTLHHGGTESAALTRADGDPRKSIVNEPAR